MISFVRCGRLVGKSLLPYFYPCKGFGLVIVLTLVCVCRMMKCMMAFHDESQKAIKQGHTWSKVRESTAEIQQRLRSMKFELPGDGEEVVVGRYEELMQALTEKFASVVDE